MLPDRPTTSTDLTLRRYAEVFQLFDPGAFEDQRAALGEFNPLESLMKMFTYSMLDPDFNE